MSVPLPQTSADTLVLCTDAIIEGRGKEIDTGLHRLTTGARDDIALIAGRLQTHDAHTRSL